MQILHDPDNAGTASEAAHAFQLNLQQGDIMNLFLTDGAIICDETHPLTFIGEIITEL